MSSHMTEEDKSKNTREKIFPLDACVFAIEQMFLICIWSDSNTHAFMNLYYSMLFFLAIFSFFNHIYYY